MILVTGASGFLGQHLVRKLSQEQLLVRAIYNNTSPSPALENLPGIHWIKADLLDVYDVDNIMQGIDEVYHCAAIVSFDTSDKENLLHTNIETTANVVNGALTAGVRKLAYASSVAAIGRSNLDLEISEDTEWEDGAANSVYSKSKYFAEMEVWRGMAEGLNAVIVNPGIILGEGDWDKGSAKLIKTADEEFPFYTEGVNAWADVLDVVEILFQLMNSDISNERFIVSAGSYGYRDIFTMMANALGKKPPYLKAGKVLTGLVWRWNALKSLIAKDKPTVTRETANTARKKVFYNNNKLLEFLPKFSYRPINTTIERMAGKYQTDKNLR